MDGKEAGMILTVFLGGLVALFILGFGAPYAIGVVSVAVLLIQRGVENFSFEIVASKIAFSANNFTLLAIPFFLFAGKLMNTGSITGRIFNFCNTLVGWLPGGLGHSNVLASIVFAGMSGSAVADAAGLGTIEIKAMEDQGFDTEFSAGITAASSTIGPIIPPSIPLIVFGVSAGGVSVAKLLIGGIVPGLLMGISLMIMVAYFSLKRHYPRTAFPKPRDAWLGLKNSFFPLLTPIILIGGILSGVFTPTEGAAVAALYALILTALFYREISPKDVLRILRDTAKETACIMVIVCVSSLYGYLLVRTQFPELFLNTIFSITHNKIIILLLLNVFFLVIGCFMETNAALIILTPILMPLTTQLGIDPVHLGLVVVLNLMIGLITPPVGMCLYATSKVAHLSLDRMIRGTMPFYLPLFITLMLITFIPDLVTWLPNLLIH
jgi:tripartite ATP-independent transporter DctM subunit